MQLNIFSTILIAFAVSVLICPLLIRVMRKLQFGQHVREDGPIRHLSKAGTPTAGGVVFLVAATAALLLRREQFWSWEMGLIIFVTLGNALIGWFDDYAKMTHSRSMGLKARSKLAGQFVVAAFFIAGLLYLNIYDPAVAVPFTKMSLQMGYFYPLFIIFMITAESNGVNLTDGIDGLATGAAIIALLAFLYIAVNKELYGVALFCGALVGGCFGFLVYNLHPARIFMGDVGSLALGGALAGAAVMVKEELLLVFIGGVFVLETLSVALQVISFKLTGRRILLMAPLHHHFELKGRSEWQVVTGFWGLSFIFALAGLIEFWLRTA